MFANKFTTYPTNMEAKNRGYLLKNITIPTKQHYLKSLIDKVESLIKMESILFLRNQTYATPITQQILVLNQTVHHHRMKSLPLSKMDFMIWRDLSNLNQSEIIFNPR